MQRSLHIIFSIGMLSLLTGCVQTRITEPKRSAVEQLLLSTATDRALENADFRSLSGRKVFLHTNHLDAFDKEYVIGTIRDLLSQQGALLVNEQKEAAVIIEARSGALSTDGSESILGLPSTPLPIPFTGTINTPELYLFKSQKQLSTAKLALFAYEQESKKHLHSTGPLIGRAHHNYYKFLGYFRYTATNLPEKKRAKNRNDRE